MTSRQTLFGLELRRHRLTAGLTQEELAERAGLSADAISALERGVRRRAYPSTVRSLIAALELSGGSAAALTAAASETVADKTPIFASTTAPWSGLPIPPNSILGREREEAAADRLLNRPDVRLLTLTGPGGVGKTRLALHLATGARDRFASACFVDLAPVTDVTLVPSAIARALGLREESHHDLQASIVAFIGDRAVLLLLDNFEHLITAAPIVAALLTRCPRLTILVTSRAALRLQAEHAFAVKPLALPQTDRPLPPQELLGYAAVRLFVERAQAVDPGFTLSQRNVFAVADICRQLDGLPLAIELAAARTRVLPPSEILSRLKDRFALLVAGPVDVPPRHRALRATIDWSFDHLGPAEQRLFRRLAVFVGGFTLDAAERMGNPGVASDHALPGGGEGHDDVFALIDTLTSMSLLVRADSGGADAPRFAMLETIREYALERLERSGEATAIRDAHAAHFLALAEQSEFERIDAGQRAWLDLLEAEHANLLSALDWLMQRDDLDAALRLAVACSWFWSFRSHYTEGRTRLESLLARSDAASHDRARAAAMYMLGSLTRVQGDSARAIQLHEASVAVWRELQDPFHLAYALSRYGVALMYAGDERAISVLSECVAITQTLPDQRWVGGARWELGRAQHYQGYLESAAENLASSLAKARELGNPTGIAFSLWALGDLAWDQGDKAGGCALLREALSLLRDLGEAWSLLLCLERLAATGASHEQQWAVRLLAAAEAWRRAVGLPRPQAEESRHKSAVDAVRDALGQDAFMAAWNDGSSLSPDQAIAMALG